VSWQFLTVQEAVSVCKVVSLLSLEVCKKALWLPPKNLSFRSQRYPSLMGIGKLSGEESTEGHGCTGVRVHK
jgi:hypothetical protein